MSRVEGLRDVQLLRQSRAGLRAGRCVQDAGGPGSARATSCRDVVSCAPGSLPPRSFGGTSASLFAPVHSRLAARGPLDPRTFSRKSLPHVLSSGCPGGHGWPHWGAPCVWSVGTSVPLRFDGVPARLHVLHAATVPSVNLLGAGPWTCSCLFMFPEAKIFCRFYSSPARIQGVSRALPPNFHRIPSLDA